MRSIKLPVHIVMLLTSTALLEKGFGQDKPGPSVERKEYLDLARKIYTWADDKKSQTREHLGEAQEDQVVQKMRRVIQRQAIDAIKRGNGDSGIVANIRPFLSVSLSIDTDFTNTPYSKCFALNGDPYCLAAYTILRGSEGIPDSQCYIDFFSGRNGPEPVSIGSSDFRGHAFFVKEVPAKLSGQEWVLAWGSVLGDTGARLSARLYSFDGERIKTIWSRDGLSAGHIEILDGFVRLDYDPYYHSLVSERKTETLYFTPNGLQ